MNNSANMLYFLNPPDYCHIFLCMDNFISIHAYILSLVMPMMVDIFLGWSAGYFYNYIISPETHPYTPLSARWSPTHCFTHLPCQWGHPPICLPAHLVG